MNLSEFLSSVTIANLNLPHDIIQKLQAQDITDCLILYERVRSYRISGTSSIQGLTKAEMRTISHEFTALLQDMGQPKSDRLTGKKSAPIPKDEANATSKPVLPARKPRSTNTTPVQIKPPIKPHKAPPAKPNRESRTSPLISALKEWERRLAPEVRKVELIGEISINEKDLTDLTNLIAELFYTEPESIFFQVMKNHFPATFLVFMVGIGIFGYEGGDFWSACRKTLKSNLDQVAFGQLFESNIQKFKKPIFRELQERSMRYVSPILAHGGIPVYCLKDFFSNIVLNCSNRPELVLLEGEELIDEILKHSTYTAATDKPVLNFLEYGGVTAANLLSRSRKMMYTWQQRETLLSTEEAGLPQHITNYFAEWTREHQTSAINPMKRQRLKRPHLSVDPWGLGVFLTLPSQPATTRDSGNLSWRIQTDSGQQDLPARTQRRGDQIETREISLRLNEITREIKLQFIQGEQIYTWILTGLSDKQYILAFDPVSGHAQNHIRAQECWLLLPGEFTLSVTAGTGRILEVLPDLPGVWSQYKLEAWDLSRAVKIALHHGDTQVTDIYVRGQETIELPVLENGTILPTDLEENPLPVYSGCPPNLRIPIGPSEDFQLELNRWEMKIKNIIPSFPEISKQMTLADLGGAEISGAGSSVQVHLSAETLLTSRPTGAYQIEIKGPLGRDTEMSFYILPDCEISDLQELYLPDLRNGTGPATFTLYTSLFSGVDSLDPSQGVTIECIQPGKHQITVPSEKSVIGLLIRQENVQQLIRVPLYLRINRVRWRMVDDLGYMEDWCQEPITLSLQQLIQEPTPLLIVDLPGNNDGRLHLNLAVSDLHGNLIQNLEPAPRSSSRASRFWRFDLSRIKHAMEVSDSPIFRVNLILTDKEDISYKQTLPMLVYTLDIQLMQLQTAVEMDGQRYHIQLNWVEKKPLQARALILWSLFRPWQPPLVEKIPDSSIGEHAFSFPVEQHWGGIYRMQMVILDPWTPSPPPSRPPGNAAFISHDIEVSSPAERLQELTGRAPKSSRSEFSRRLEAAYIKHHLGQAASAFDDLKACCLSLQSTSSREILAVHSLLAQEDFKSLQEVFSSQISSPDILRQLLQDQKSEVISGHELSAILKTLRPDQSWPLESCEILAQMEDPRTQYLALQQMVRSNSSQAVTKIMDLIHRSLLSYEDAVEILYEERFAVSAHLKKLMADPVAAELMDLLQRFNLFSGLPVIRVGSWVLTNAGWGRIEEILDPHTRVSVESFMEGGGQFILSVSMHIYESADLTGEKAILNMPKMELAFPRASQIFQCQHCHEFSTAKLDLFKSHLLLQHENAIPTRGIRDQTVPVTRIQFNLDPMQKREE